MEKREEDLTPAPKPSLETRRRREGEEKSIHPFCAEPAQKGSVVSREARIEEPNGRSGVRGEGEGRASGERIGREEREGHEFTIHD